MAVRRSTPLLLSAVLIASILVVPSAPAPAEPLHTRVKLIVAGTDADIADYPYQVALIISNAQDGYDGHF